MLRVRGQARRVLFAGIAVAAVALAGCSDRSPEPAPSPSSTPSTAPVTLTVGVFGAAGEVAALTQSAEAFGAEGQPIKVSVTSFADRDDAARAYRSTSNTLPDVFMLSQRDLAWFTERKLTQPVDELLDERGVSFGDEYSRDALEAFAADNSLVCMPYSVSPMVIFYNTRLVDFDRMAARGLDVPEEPTSWTFDQFTAAAQFATRPRLGTRGVYIEPTLRGLSPFIYAGGGKVFDDPTSPSSLAFSDGDTKTALETALALLRDAQVTPTKQQLDEADPLELFKAGKLGMIAGYRSMVPELRQVAGLSFDVMPMPRITRSATVGDVTGLCMSAATEHPAEAADLLVHLLSEETVSAVAEQGYLVPANVEVATSDAFVQPGRQPANASVFNASVRSIEVPPLLDSWTELDNAVGPLIKELVTVPILDLDTLTAQIDLESQSVLGPPSESPSGSPSSTADGAS